MGLNANEVDKLFRSCLSENGETVEGIVHNYRLDVKGKEAEIWDMLKELPDEFHSNKGGGWSFLNACMDRDGNQWADLHFTMEQLCCLGIASKQASWLFARYMWSSFPGGMPYVKVWCVHQS